MSQERWDVKLQFLDGPLRFQDLPPARGPVVRIGANPGPGGVRLAGYRGIDDRQAVITVYDGAHVSIAPVGVNQVRVATHSNVDWAELLPIQKHADLSPGSVVHLGPPNRGCTFAFVEARRLGDWQQKSIVSLDEQARQLDSGGTIDTTGGRPWWFIPAVLAITLLTTVGVVASQLSILKPDPPKLGPVEEGEKVYKRVDVVNLSSIDLTGFDMMGLEQAFGVFVMNPNATESRMDNLRSNPAEWDQRFLQYFKISVALHARAWTFWTNLESKEEQYADVVDQLRKAGLPDVFAAIPYQESQYRAEAQSPVCAKGWWQFMPEVALRGGMKVANCRMPGGQLFTPTEKVPVRGVLKNAPYVRRTATTVSCAIKGCDVDDRVDLTASTQGAIALLSEAWRDEELKGSGAVVQMTILSHNAGYDDQRFDKQGRTRPMNILPAYRRHLKVTKQKRDPAFYGANITCVGEEYGDIMRTNERCGGVLANQTQHYAYSIVAQHVLAACYYAKNHGNRDVWKDYGELLAGSGYCSTLNIPSREQVLQRSGNKGARR